METSSTSLQLIKKGRTLTIFLVAAGYILTFLTAAWGETRFSVLQIVIGVLLGVMYVILAMFDTEILRRFPANFRLTLYFLIQIALVFGIGWMLGPGGTWLIGLPLASVAVERLTPPWRWPVYISLLAAIVLPILRYSTLETALMNSIVISTGIFFVVFTSQLRLNEQHARREAEKLAKDLETANHQLAKYTVQVKKMAVMEERNRLAREIHDNLGHYLTIVNVQLEAASLTFNSEPARALDALTKAREQARKGLNAVRESVAVLRVSPVENRPPDLAIADLVEEMKGTGINAHYYLRGTPRPVEEKVALALYRIAQEGLTNVRKHAPAACARVILDFSQNGKISLAVKDDGPGAVDTNHGFGLVGMKERVQLLGGEFRVETAPNRGFYLEISIPVAENP